MDAALIGAAQRVEHYEIAAYGTVSEFARILGESEHISLLEETLEEEKETDQKLTATGQGNQSPGQRTKRSATRKKIHA
jgi:ferritin-like metal-binding protein YciE